jgi:hypothetical protein
MKVPHNCQVFDHVVLLNSKDAERLTPHLSGWCRLNEVFLLGVNVPDLERLVILELMRVRPRPQIIERLLGRIFTLHRAAINTRIESCLKSR